MDSSDLQRRHHQYSQQQQQQQQTMSSGLMRYRSAPSSYFATLLNSGADGGGNCDEFLNHRPTSPETERILARLISADAGQDSSSHNLEQNPSQFMPSMKQETDNFHHQESSGYSSGLQTVYQNQSRPSLPNQNSAASNSITMDQMTQMKMSGGVSNSNLIRHSSSPAGLFSHINIENGYGVIGGGMGNFGGGNGTNTEASYPSTTRLNGQMDFSSGPPSSSGRMTPISENENKRMEMTGPNDRIFGEGHTNDRDYITGFPIGSWDDSVILSDNFLQRAEEDDKKAFSGMNASENQNAGVGNFPPRTVLSHHLSLPTSSAELSAMEKLLQFQDSVPCKIRAKRGCATHPRSIAERVRRTRISERMRKLQELVPNMDKQTNTADMLDLAVDYIKDLQRQVKTLTDNRAKCTCSNQQKLAQKA